MRQESFGGVPRERGRRHERFLENGFEVAEIIVHEFESFIILAVRVDIEGPLEEMVAWSKSVRLDWALH